MDAFVFSLLLLLLGTALIILELFVPSGGLITFLAVVSVITGLIIAFFHSVLLGTVMLAAIALGLPLLLALIIRIWPRTPIGRRVLLGRPRGEEVLPDVDERAGLRQMVGRQGRAKSKMLPSGIVIIDGKEYDAVSQGMPIDAGQAVRVVDVEVNHIIVRPLDRDEAAADRPPDDILSQPLDSLGLDPFDDPLG